MPFDALAFFLDDIARGWKFEVEQIIVAKWIFSVVKNHEKFFEFEIGKERYEKMAHVEGMVYVQ